MPNRIKIIHVVLSLDIGGLEMLVTDMLRHMDRDRFDAVVVCIRQKGALAERMEGLGFRVYSLGGKDRLEWGAFFKLAGLLRRENADVVHCHNTAGYLYGGIAAILAGFKKIIYTEHGRVFPDSPRRMLAERILSWFTYKIVAVSQDMKRCLVEYEKIDPKKIDVIYNGVDKKKFAQAQSSELRMQKRKELGIGQDDIVIGNVARFDPVKDHACLIRAFALMKQRAESGELRTEKSLRLLCVGDGTEFESIKRLCKELNLLFVDFLKSPDQCSALSAQHSVLFMGSRTDIPELMNIMDVFVLSSKNEGISLTLLEAMACGVPVVATRVGGNPEIVKDGENGLLCEPGDPQDLADKIFKVFNLPSAQRSALITLTDMLTQYEILYAGK